MNTEKRRSRVALIGCLAAILVGGGVFAAFAWAAANQSRPADYQGYDLARPWFDGKSWDWFLDMFNQPSLKPQEEGTIQQFPLDSVPRTGVEPFIPPMAMRNNLLLRDQMPLNPQAPTGLSIARGDVLYQIYCAVCHGDKGQGGTPVVAKGMPAIPLKALMAVFSESHLYNKILYGQPIMPAYGFQTSAQDRWDMVNFLKSPQFGQGGSQ